ncbi:alpha/beta-hydrolase [Daedaleopsis nitida]|nr:alpha/beta-hydrolase [Daedaleopsis nitida]
MSYTSETYRNVFTSKWAKKGLTFIGKRYIPQRGARDGVTLIFFHCTGSHKEVWEPTIEYLFSNVKDPATEAAVIREAWSFDMHNHGESAVFNEEVLKEGTTGLTVEECGEGMKAFHATGILNGHKLVGVGHSLGVSALVLSTISDDLPGVEYKDLVLIEPALITRELFTVNREDREGALRRTNYAISKRQDQWASREEARQYFNMHTIWQMWDRRVLELYVLHGLREVTVDKDGETTSKTILCCNKEYERRAYVQDEVYFHVIDRIKSLDPSVSLHYIFGKRFDLMRWVYQSVIDERKPKSIQTVPKAGHLTVQENPEGLSTAIAQILQGQTAEPVAKL